ncbi:MAG: hypothetical protein ACI3YI_03180 [Bacteroidaceae bacterium]
MENNTEITPQILEKNGFELNPDVWLWSQFGDEFTNYIHIQFRKNGGVRKIELNFKNVVLYSIMSNGICPVDWLN